MLRTGGEVCVLGAGLTGATAALELARSGAEVVLLDRDHQPLNRASLRNEGKIHLGFVFAKDDTLATPDLMLEGALSFRRILSRLLGKRIDSISTSTPFTYLVSEDSLLSPAELHERYAAIERLYVEKLRMRPDYDYLGRRPEALFQRIDLGELSPHFRAEHLIGAFRTEELAIDTFELAQALRSAISASPRIRFMPHRHVIAVERRAGQFRVKGTSADGDWQVESGQIVNALWESRFQIDRTLGIEHAPGWLHRLKYRVIGRIPDRLRGGPSVTMVLGPYGDVVIRSDGTAYFSWYPLGLQGWSHALSPPDSWTGPCKGEIDGQTASIAASILSAIDLWYPGAAESETILVDAGVIVAYGRSDVDDPKSGLHNRTRVGVMSLDGYHTVDPGKLTTAPLFGLQAAQQVLGIEVTE
jgi:hypothetical protein